MVFGRNVLTLTLAEGVEVIADDFLIAGFGSTDREVNQSLERNERAFLEKCRL